MAKLNLRQIEAFNAVMQAGSVTRAASALAVSQPAVTKLIQSFERACELRLFERETGRLVPTPEALLLYEETARFGDGALRVQSVARAIGTLTWGRVTITAFPGVSAQLIPRALAPRLTGSDVRLIINTRSSGEIETSMVAQPSDFAISMIPTEHPSLECQPFVPVRMVCAISVNSPLAERDSISLADLSGKPLIVLGRNDLSYSIIEAAFGAHGCLLKPAVEVQLSESACAMSSAGGSVAIVTALSLIAPRDPGLVFRPLTEEIAMKSWLITSRLTQSSQIALEFREAIRGAMVELAA